MHRIGRRVAGAVAALLVGTLVGVGPHAQADAGEPNPLVEGPIGGGIHGYQWNHSLFDLAQYDYTENEYFFSGVSASHQNGVPASAPYRSRFFVRLPRDAAKFNGTVVVEWLNVTDQDDLETVWPPAGEYMMRNGFGYVGVSAQLAGVCCGPTTLKGWDPLRYATLVHPGDNFSYDIFTQAIQALRDPAHNRTYIGAPTPVDPMLGMTVKHVIANGASQSAGTLTTYINNGYNNHHLIDLYQITRGGGPFNDLSTPVVQLNEEAQGPHPADIPGQYALWEEAGTAHAPAAWYNYIWQEKSRDQAVPGAPNAINAACGLNRGSVDYSARAGMAASQKFLEDGTWIPSADRLVRVGTTVQRDGETMALGGLRHPFIEVPVALNRSETTDCPLFGLYKSWPAAKIRGLYPTHQDYVDRVTAAANDEVARGLLLPEDRDDVIAKAQRFDGPWVDGSCYDTYNATANENGAVSTVIGDASFNPNLPLGAQAAIRDVNCNAIAALGL